MVSKLIACRLTIIWCTMLGMDVWVDLWVRTGWVCVGFVPHVHVCGTCGAMNGVDLLNWTRAGLDTFLSSWTLGAGICGMGLITPGDWAMPGVLLCITRRWSHFIDCKILFAIRLCMSLIGGAYVM
jgi:hypothetical protein